MRFLSLIFWSSIYLIILLLISLAQLHTLDLAKIESGKLDDITTIATAIPTFIVALLLYRRFSGSQLLVDRQTEEVMDLLDHLNDIGIFIMPVDVSGPNIKQLAYTDIRLKDYAIVKEYFRDYAKVRYKDYTYYADDSLLQVADYLMYLASSLYMPKAIVKKLDYHFNYATDWWTGRSDNKKRKTKSFNVSISHRKYFNEKYEPDSRDYIHVDIYQLSEGLQAVYDTSVKWIHKKNPEVFRKLNINQKIHKN